MNHTVATALVLCLALLCAGCMGRQSLDAYVVNETRGQATVYVALTESGTGEEAYNETFALQPGARADLTDFPPEDGTDYLVRAWIDGGPSGERELSWSRQTGPDEFGIRVTEDEVEFNVVIV